MTNLVYMDHAATTKLDSRAFEAMVPFLTEDYGNPSSIYSISRNPKSMLRKTRDIVAKAINAKSHEVYFTSGGTEANNWAIKGIARANQSKGRHIISQKTEHHAVLSALDSLAREGYEITLLNVDNEGLVSPMELMQKIRPDTVLVTIMAANNEIGTLQPIREIGRICMEKGVYFHTDAVQAVGAISLDVEEMCIDALSMSAHKFYGPKGTGALYVRGGILIDNLLDGGSQEKGRRAGTENVAGIAGMARALEIALELGDEENLRIARLRDKLTDGLLQIPFAKLNGPSGAMRLPNNVNVSFDGIEGEELLVSLDIAGLLASSGSACTSGALDPSHVLMAIGNDKELSRGSLRLTLGRENTEADVEKAIKIIDSTISRQRALRNGRNR
ncbi:cysteine desulfurase family protein [Youngiibacter multivorans]|uniref:cysteine desulfurase n=1 Tax=Youngiibacter multivorans TaxID=937251 RepID=A0ABS4G6Y2_9CLOT|nr:IscS subfamily cysteine desulfurase [Youngiibacter multivorans]MBP1920030.1 cysteine desulfurase [Youngiibacter multivorans]